VEAETIGQATKAAFQRELLAEVTPELIAEYDRMVGMMESVQAAVGLAERDLSYTRPHMHQTKFMQGIVTGGDSALSYVKRALVGEDLRGS
jgi:hypothetical protein